MGVAVKIEFVGGPWDGKQMFIPELVPVLKLAEPVKNWWEDAKPDDPVYREREYVRDGLTSDGAHR